MDEYLMLIGMIISVVGGGLLAALIIGVLANMAADVWIGASVKWRGIVKAESLIIEFKEYREEFFKWYNGGGRNNV